MNALLLAPFALVAVLALDPETQQRSLPSQQSALEARVVSLEAEVKQLQTDVTAFKTHVHTVNLPRIPTTYMSIHDLSIAMQPHSATPTTQYFIPLMLAPGGAPSVSGVRATTSTPTEGP